MTKVDIGKKSYDLEIVHSFPGKTMVGQIRYDDKVIRIAKFGGITGFKRSKQEIEDTFWHEVVHGVLHDMGNMLAQNEKFVEGVASRLSAVIRQVYPNGSKLVTQRAQGVRELRSPVPRNARASKAQGSEDRKDAVRGSASQSSGGVRKRKGAA